jgi:metallo-beta-lactamase class B
MLAPQLLNIIHLLITLFCADISQSDVINFEKISDHCYIHQSFLQTESFGKVGCNGLVYIKDGEAIIFDTPATNEGSLELIDKIESEYHAKIKAVIVSHSHEDCLGGLDVFHDANIPSFAYDLTIKFAAENGESIPQNGFSDQVITRIGSDSVVTVFLGEGHTKDNIVSYIPDDKVLFGGCLIKEIDGSKGYVAEANLAEWSNTVKKVKEMFNNSLIIVPGHGRYGNQDLLDYTMKLFAKTDE